MATILDDARRQLRSAWEARPLTVILLAAATLRLASALFSPGFAFHDDHFAVVEVAQHWVDGGNDWLGSATSLRSLVYPWLHAVLFGGLEAIGVHDPQLKMLAARLAHAAWSMLTVLYGYKLALELGGERRARLAGVLLAAFWLMPSMAVRNLVETVCQPPLVAGAYFLVRAGRSVRAEPPLQRSGASKHAGWDEALAGALFGLAFTIRFQVAVMVAALGLWLLLRRGFFSAARFSAGFVALVAVLLGGSDWIGYGRPFSSALAYFRYNSAPSNIALYPQGPWYQYVGLVLAVLIPPLGVLLAWGLVRSWRAYGVLFWPALAFFVLHSLYPNKQERFILPILPYILVLAVLGWEALRERSAWWRERASTLRGLWIAFWCVNAVLYGLVGLDYWKKTRVEPLTFIAERGDATGVVLEIAAKEVPDPPLFYLGRALPVYELGARDDVAALSDAIRRSDAPPPNYVVLIGVKDVEARLARLAPLFPALEPVGTISPSHLDALLHAVNPRHHVNLTSTVYRVAPPRAEASTRIP